MLPSRRKCVFHARHANIHQITDSGLFSLCQMLKLSSRHPIAAGAVGLLEMWRGQRFVLFCSVFNLYFFLTESVETKAFLVVFTGKASCEPEGLFWDLRCSQMMIAASAKQIDRAESLTKEFSPELEENGNATWITHTATVERSDDSLSTNQSSACLAPPCPSR